MFHNFTHDSSVVEFVLQKSFVSFIKVFWPKTKKYFAKTPSLALRQSLTNILTHSHSTTVGNLYIFRVIGYFSPQKLVQ